MQSRSRMTVAELAGEAEGLRCELGLLHGLGRPLKARVLARLAPRTRLDKAIVRSSG